MAPRTTFAAAACTVAAAALFLTACGGGSHDDKIAATTPASAPPPTTASSSPTPTTAPGAPTFDFPSDVKIKIDADTTGDKTKDAILRDQAYAENATYMAIVKLDPELPIFTQYVIADAQANWSNNIIAGKKGHHTITGTVHIYDRKVTVSSATRAGVTFCEDQRYSYDKDTQTGKVLKTKPSANSFIFHSSLLLKSKDGTWQTASYNSQRGAARCQL
ncbi:hypothetical protein [Actinacidiphila sp. bgisy144]|uniref:hypothetical protein n=1 Tax=Actinacidiphila sp. bgisy144 TaxID=3413791 RepID=UPI003EB931BD